MTSDPFRALGLTPNATAEEVRAARRRLAKTLHPDAGGDSAAMQRVNRCAAEALRQIQHERSPERAGAQSSPPTTHRSRTGSGEPSVPEAGAAGWNRVRFDVPSFTVEALPVETFHALLLASDELGVVTEEDPPYLLEVELEGPPRAWCRLEIVPDAGASTVSLAAASDLGQAVPIEAVRDRWIEALNRLDWTRLGA